jgi:hypothetical protein
MTCILESPRPAAIAAAIMGHAYVETAASTLATLRDAPSPSGAPALPARFLRHADEHTVVAMRSVLEAIAAGAAVSANDRVAIVAAPCQSGRVLAARSLAQLAVGGAVTVSPHLVPQASLHSVAGAVSVAFGWHGPHLGVGGGPDALAEGLIAAATLLAAGSGCDAAWLIATDWQTEPSLDADGGPTGDPVCRSLAIALVPAAVAGARPMLVLDPAAPAVDHASTIDLATLARAITSMASAGEAEPWCAECPWGGTLTLVPAARAANIPFLRASA